MTYNVWGGGGNENKPVNETVAVIKAAKADIIGIQESRLESDPCTASCLPTGTSVARALAESLGYYYYDQTKENAALWANAILSRFPILNDTTKNDLGVSIDIGTNVVHLFNIHLTDFPYGPYQLLGIPYEPAPFLDTAREAILAAMDARGPGLELLMADLSQIGEDDIAFVTGDFNEPSHSDWTHATVAAGQQPLTVEWPSSKSLEGVGFVDAMRKVHPDPVKKPAFTWTPTTDAQDPDDHHDRIDFVFVRGKNVRVVDAAVVGEKSPEADIIVTPWPSDHRAIVAQFEF
jgi:exonuclease III